MKRITIDRDKCSGHGRCYTLAAPFFEPDEEGFPVILDEREGADDANLSLLLAAAENCPERAIAVTDED